MVLGVNGYNESKGQIAGFGAQLKLDYPLLLNGNRLALRSFFVPNYPANYWIDRKGNVVDYSYDFDRDKTPAKLRKKTKALLGK